MLVYDSVIKLAEMAADMGKNISDLVLEDQAQQLEKPAEELFLEMKNRLAIMNDAAVKGMSSSAASKSGLSGGDAFKMKKVVDENKSICGPVIGKILAKALAVAEVNACMGRIVAAPTAGSCGIIPAAILTVKEVWNIPEEKAVMSLFTASGIGLVIAAKASISGAEGGCQAECGSAAAMAAAAVVEMAGGSPVMCAHACAFALKNVMGLVCDPVAGLVEVPCVKRNASGAVNALISAELALAGIESRIPPDEVIAAMKSVGDAMSTALKETAEGGLASTPTATQIFQPKNHRCQS